MAFRHFLEKHQTRKGNQWFFGMKAHIGVDKDSGLIHSVSTTGANVCDVTVTAELLHGEERVVYGDAGYWDLPSFPSFWERRQPQALMTTDSRPA